MCRLVLRKGYKRCCLDRNADDADLNGFKRIFLHTFLSVLSAFIRLISESILHPFRYFYSH
jgi:hypothetical protein